ncbi:MAG TPA: ABC transporter ATP-binding protein [Solirubrobacteraceae bacterium]|jgi:ABC-2 type transport system ATP-binding protein
MSSDSQLAVYTEGLTKRFGQRAAIDGVDLRVPRGSAFGFLGPNGAGKTTMIRTLLGLTHASSGSMSLLGHELPAQRAQALRRVGAIVEEPRFHPHLSGRENLRIIAAVRGPEVRERIEPALRRVGLSERADEKVKKYSLGMRQRLGVARCLLADPLLLILDEPTNGLDPGGIQEFRVMIRALVEQEGRTIFLSSHLLDEVEKICDHVAIVDRGKVVVQGAIAELAGAASGSHSEVIFGVDDSSRTLEALESDPAVREAHRSDDGIHVVLEGDPQSAAAINARLVGVGIAVMRIEHVRQSLEQRFLQITSRLGAPAGALAESQAGIQSDGQASTPTNSQAGAPTDSQASTPTNSQASTPTDHETTGQVQR